MFTKIVPFTVCEAKFIGSNGPLGYTTGKMYLIRIEFNKHYIVVYCKNHFPFPYDTQRELFNDWEIKTGEL